MLEVLFLLHGITDSKLDRGSNEIELDAIRFRTWHHICVTTFWKDNIDTDISVFVDGSFIETCKYNRMVACSVSKRKLTSFNNIYQVNKQFLMLSRGTMLLLIALLFRYFV